tara:strand:+ start:69 stop:461 length:393 start_codon:yes stop_codon:yes gene_type:complete
METHILNFKQDKPFRDLLINTVLTKEKMKLPYENKYTKEKGFWLVKDEGIYLMNAFKCKRKKPIVTYAEGYSPKDNDQDDLWEKTHCVSGDDFAEFIPLSKEQYQHLLYNLNAYFRIKFSETQLEMSIIG